MVWTVMALVTACGGGDEEVAGPEVLSERVEVLYDSVFRDLAQTKDRRMVGFRADLRGIDEPCVVEWEARLAGAKGIATILGGERFVSAGQSVTVTDVVGLRPEEADAIERAETTWTPRCGESLAEGPHLGQLAVLSARARLEDVGGSEVRSTEVELVGADSGGRCDVLLVVHDVDAHGFALDRDQKRYSLGTGAARTTRVLDSTVIGVPVHYEALVEGTVAHLEDLRCPDALDPATGTGLEVVSSSWRHEQVTSPLVPYQDLIWPDFELRNTLDQDCAFDLTLEAADASGFALGHRGAWTVHLRAGSQARFEAPTAIPVWKEQIEDLAGLVPVHASPRFGHCRSFEPSRAL